MPDHLNPGSAELAGAWAFHLSSQQLLGMPQAQKGVDGDFWHPVPEEGFLLVVVVVSMQDSSLYFLEVSVFFNLITF